VTDANGLEVTIDVPWNGAATCCEDVPLTLAFQTPWSEINSISWPGEVVVFLDGGCPPFDWTIAGANFTLDYAATNSRRNRVHGAVGADSDDLTIVVEDLCGACVCLPGLDLCGPCGFVHEGETLSVAVQHGSVPIDWEWIGDHVGWTLAEAQSADLDVDITVVADPTNKSVTLKAMDAAGCTDTVTLGVDDEVEFDGDYGRHPFVKKISNGIVAISYEGPDGDSPPGYTKTYSVNSDAQLTYIDVLEHRDASVSHHQSCVRSSGVLCTSYVESGGNLGISAILIDGSGNMSQHASSYLQYYPSGGSGSYHALFARSETSGGIIVAVHDTGGDIVYAESMTVTDEGEVIAPIIQRLKIAAVCSYPHGAMIGESVFLAVWQDSENKLSGRTVSVSATGVLTNLSNETQFTTFAAAEFQVLKVKDGWALVLCRNALNGAYIIALQISSGGVITIPAGSVYKFTDDHYGIHPTGYVVDESHIAIVTNDDDSYGLHFWQFEVSLGDTVSWTQLEHYDYGIVQRQEWSIDKVRDNVLAIGYFDEDNDGRIRTKRICY